MSISTQEWNLRVPHGTCLGRGLFLPTLMLSVVVSTRDKVRVGQGGAGQNSSQLSCSQASSKSWMQLMLGKTLLQIFYVVYHEEGARAGASVCLVRDRCLCTVLGEGGGNHVAFSPSHVWNHIWLATPAVSESWFPNPRVLEGSVHLTISVATPVPSDVVLSVGLFRVILLSLIWFVRHPPVEPVQWTVCGTPEMEI